jgi:hypothetical protein
MKASNRPCRVLAPLAPLLVALVASSCLAVAAAGAGAAATYGALSVKNNHVTREFRVAPERARKATIYALKAQDYRVLGEPEPDSIDGEFNIAGGTVWVRPEPGGTTSVRIRIGTFESEENLRAAKLLMEEIARRLGE